MRQSTGASRVLFGAIGVVGALTLVLAETRRPLRAQHHSKLERDLRNLALAGLTAATLQLLQRPVIGPLSHWVERRRRGLLQAVRMPGWVRIAAAVCALDYTLYLWHVLTHRSAFLWRFHRVHHCDLDMDASTAIRFHFGEMALSIPYRAAQVLLLGIGPSALSIWQALTTASILFQHSNLRLATGFERRLQALLVTPRLHGIHHSTVKAQRDANWSSGLTIWDRLHGTLRLDIPQSAIEIGVGELRDPGEVTLPKLLAMPSAAKLQGGSDLSRNA